MTDLLIRTTYAISLALALSFGATVANAAVPLLQEPAAPQDVSVSDRERKCREIEKDLEDLQRRKDQLAEDAVRVTADFQSPQLDLTGAVQALDRIIKNLADTRLKLAAKQQELEQCEKDLQDARQKQAQEEERKKDEQHVQFLGEQDRAVKNLIATRDTLRAEVNRLSEAEALCKNTVQALETEVSRLKLAIQTLQSQTDACSAALQKCGAELQQCKADMERTVNESAGWKTSFEGASAKLTAAESDLAAVREQLEQKSRMSVELAAKVTDLEHQLSNLMDENSSLSLSRLIALLLFGLSGLVLISMWICWLRRRWPFAVPQGPSLLSAAMLAAERQLDRCTTESSRTLASRDPNGEYQWLCAARRSHRVREAMASAAILPADGVDESVRRAVELICGLAADELSESKKSAFELCKALHQHGAAVLPARKRAACDATKGRTAVLMAEAFRQAMDAQRANIVDRKSCLEWTEWALERANDWFETKDDAPVHLERARLNLQQAQAESDHSKKAQFLRAAKDQAELCIKSLPPSGFASVLRAPQAPLSAQAASPVPGPIGEAHLVWLDSVLQLLQAQNLDETERQNHLRWTNELAQSYGGDQEFRAVVAWRLAQMREASSDVVGAAAAWAEAANLSFRWSDLSIGSLAFSPKGEYGAECMATLCRRELTQIDSRRRPEAQPLRLDPDVPEFFEPAPEEPSDHLVRNWRDTLRSDVMRLAALKQWTAVGGRLAGQLQLEALPGVWNALKQRSMEDLSALKTVGAWTISEVRAFDEALKFLDGPSADAVEPSSAPSNVGGTPNFALIKDPMHPSGSTVLVVDFGCIVAEDRRGWIVDFDQGREIKHVGLFGNDLGNLPLTNAPCLFAHPQGVRGVQLATIDLSNSSASLELAVVIRQPVTAMPLGLQVESQPAVRSWTVRVRLDQLGIAPPAQPQRWSREEMLRFAERFRRLMWALLAMSPDSDSRLLDSMATCLARDLQFQGEPLQAEFFSVDQYERPAAVRQHEKFVHEVRAFLQGANCTELWQQIVTIRGDALDVTRRLLARPEFLALRNAAIRAGLPVDARPDGEFGKAAGSAIAGGELLVQFGEGAAAVSQSCILDASGVTGRSSAQQGDWVRVVGTDGARRRVQLCATAPSRGAVGSVVSIRGESVSVRFDGQYQNFSEVICRPEGAPVSSFIPGLFVDVIDAPSGDQPRVTLRQSPVQPVTLPPIGAVSGWGDWFAECKRFLMAKAGSHPHCGDTEPPNNGDVAAFMRALRHQADGRNVDVAARAQALEHQGLALSRRYPPT